MHSKIFLLLLFIVIVPTHTQNTPPTENKVKNDPSLVSQKIPNLEVETDNIMDKLLETVWSTRDVPNNRNLYVFFYQNRYGNIAIPHGESVTAPTVFFPMKFVQKGPHPHSSVYIIPSREKVLYYVFYFINPYHLVISAGYDDIEPLMKMDLKKYLEDGYMLQLIF